jgi:alpha-D-xyloside xylohydrolase
MYKVKRMAFLKDRIALIVLLVITSFTGSIAQSWHKTDLGIITDINSVTVEARLYSPSTVRILKYPEGKSITKESLSVIKTPQKTEFSVRQSGNYFVLETKSLKIEIDRETGKISFLTLSSKPLLSEKENSTSFTDFNDNGEKTYTVAQAFLLDKDEAIYGLGQQQDGKMNKRNTTLNMVQGNTDDYIPFFVSVKGYGLFWDNYSPTLFEDKPGSTSFKSDVGDCIDYYFILSGDADGVIAGMRDLTGQVPMFPLWTFGYWQSKERYKSQDELVGVVKRYREIGIPLDGIIQDWQYWGNNYLWNAMEFLNPDYPDPKKMVDDIHNLNAHVIISIWNSFGPMTKQYRDLEKIGALMDFKTWPPSGSEKWPPNNDYPSGVRVYDPYNPEARDIYWDYVNKGIFSLGMDGWWMDSSEPDHLDFKPSDFDNKTFLGSFRKVRNAFPLMTVGGLSQHQRAVTSDKRVFILTRSAFAGQQRFGANTWSGDVTASWETLKNQISAGLNFSLSNIPYWNSDIGGFFLSRYRKKLDDSEYRELYARWIQFGAFCPMMRSHGTDAPREIWQFGKKGDKVYDAIEKYIDLRYRLLPYIYSASWDITSNQSTMIRALMMDFSKDSRALNINDQYMFGKSIMVCPVTNVMYSKDTKEDFSTIKSKESYLPAGTTWYDFWTGDMIQGGQNISKQTPVDIIPLYVKAGSILPLGPVVQFATEKKWDDLEIRIYPGSDGKFTLYEDENDNYDYEKGLFSTITFNWNDAKKILTIDDLKGSFPGMLAERKFNIVKVTKNKGTGDFPVDEYDKDVIYTGKKIVIKF